MSEEEISSVDSSLESAEVEFSSDVVTETTPDEETVSPKSTNSYVGKLKGIIFCLVVGLIIAVLIILALISFIVVCLYRNSKDELPKLSEYDDNSEETNTKYEYSFYSPTDDSGMKIRGSIMTPVPMTEPMSVWTDDFSQVMLIMDDEENVRIFEVFVDIHCCPLSQGNEEVEKFSFDQCEIMTNRKFEWPGDSEERVKEELSQAIHDSIKSTAMATNDGKIPCPKGKEEIVLDFTGCKALDAVLEFTCNGGCTRGEIPTFKEHNPVLAEENEVVVATMHRDYVHNCMEYTTTVEIGQAKSMTLVGKKFKDVLEEFCRAVEMEVENEVLLCEERKFSHFCVAGGGECTFKAKSLSPETNRF